MPKQPTKITAARAIYMLDRAMREKLLERAFGATEILRATQYFREAGVNGCIYCGDSQVERWDHLVSVREGGATVLGNMVPACQQCDDSKGPSDFSVWLSSRVRLNPARDNPPIRENIIRDVKAYQVHFGYTPPADFIAALSPEQKLQYFAFKELPADFRTKLAAFGVCAANSIDEEPYEDGTQE